MKLATMLQQHFPVALVARDGSMEPPSRHGIRYLVGSSGLWIEANWPWMRARFLAHPFLTGGPALYGDPEPLLELPRLRPSLFQEFLALARESAPNEMAGWILYRPEDGAQRLVIPAQVATPDTVDYQRPETGDGEFAVWDIHSHGDHPAFFSSRDNGDDLSDVKIALVVGQVGEDSPSLVSRLVVRDCFLPLQEGFS
jgi:PRTRC genetic system protein A